MESVSGTLGVQSFCFRAFRENAEVAQMVRQLGLSRIELCACHVDFNDEKTFDSVISVYRKAGVQIVAIGVEGFSDNRTAETRRFEFAAAAGAKMISAHFDLGSVPRCYRTAEALADKYGINLAIHNHGGQDWLGSPAMISHVFENTSERIGLCLDTAWMLDTGADPVRAAETFAKRLYGLHIKDFTFDSARRPRDVVVGTGNLELKALLDVVRAKAPEGVCAVLEYEGDEHNPVPALRQCASAVRNAESK